MGMKAVMATAIYLLLTATLKTQEVFDIGKFPLGTDFKDLPQENSWESITEFFGELHSMGFQTIFDTPSGKLEPGCIYWINGYPDNMFWDNHKGQHLAAVLPNGYRWIIDSRASNCDMPEDRLHRCWCWHGEPPDLTVDKNGLTCHAGAGSIIGGDWHGFLTNGEFLQC
jgi:hypothetical protein